MHARWVAAAVRKARPLAAALLLAGCGGGAPDCPDWPDWAGFRAQFMNADGRIVDRGSEDSRTVSEGQAYGLLFALAANDRAAFDAILQWTENNLAGGDLTARLPAWLWGRDAEGNWGVKDPNAASDADTWMAYALIEAGRLWQVPRFTAVGELLAARVLREAVVDLPGLGPTLLPGPFGFAEAGERWRLNPSYLPLPLLRRLAEVDAEWAPVVTSARAVILRSAVDGFAPDWTAFTAEGGFGPDPVHGTEGDYDAIRVYLWAGMTNPDDPLRNDLLAGLGGMARALRAEGVPPERVVDGVAADVPGPLGFSAALLPYLDALGEQRLLAQQRQRLAARAVPEDAYYQQALRLFGQGWVDGWLRFDRQGRLQPRWDPGC